MAYVTFERRSLARDEAPQNQTVACVALICVLASLPMILSVALTIWG
jgi:hypothetical protein